jgi:hypothetical protein
LIQEKKMTKSLRTERTKSNAGKENEEAVASVKPARKPSPKPNTASAKSSESTATVKSSHSVPVNAKPRKPVRQAKVASEPAKADKDKAAKAAKADKADKAGDIAIEPKKSKLRRDSYSIPESEHKQIAVLKKRCTDQGKPIKKSFLLRAGIQVLTLMDDDELLSAVGRVK